MIPSKIIGRASGENWIGLIDATYGIILTLLVIELPVIILETISSGQGMRPPTRELLHAIAVMLVGYFSVFTILYDIWSYHKALLFDAIKLRMFALATGWLLFTGSLAPPFYYLVNHYATAIILHDNSEGINERKYLIVARLAVFAIIAILYATLALLAKTEQRQQGQSPEKRQELQILFGTALTKALITVVLMLITDSQRLYLPSPLPVLILATLTYWPLDFFAGWSGKARRTLRRQRLR